MAISLEELQQQREQVQKHLEWLDAKISDLSSPADIVAPELDPSKPLAPQEESEPTTIAASSNSATAAAAADERSTETPTTSPQAADEQLDSPKSTAPSPEPDIESTYKPKTQNDIRRAKIGCLLLFILATALFLFLLFGLPYLL